MPGADERLNGSDGFSEAQTNQARVLSPAVAARDVEDAPPQDRGGRSDHEPERQVLYVAHDLMEIGRAHV